jgi:hypothetical protein
MLISNLVKELITWSLRNCENVKPVKKNAEIYAILKSGEKVEKCFKPSYNPNYFMIMSKILKMEKLLIFSTV